MPRKPKPEPLLTLPVAGTLLRKVVSQMFGDANVDATITGPFLIANELLVWVTADGKERKVAIGARQTASMVESKFRDQISRSAREVMEAVVRSRNEANVDA